MENSVKKRSRKQKNNQRTSRVGRRPSICQGENNNDSPNSKAASAANDVVILYWYGKNFTLDYSISRSNPDWSFLDTWYVDEVKELYRMNSNCVLSKSLYDYLCHRLFDRISPYQV